MSKRATYPYNQALDDLEAFFKRHIKDPAELQRFLGYLNECRQEGRIAFRFIHTELATYRKTYSDYFPYSSEERTMIEDLLYYWG